LDFIGEKSELIIGGYDLMYADEDSKYWDVVPIISNESYMVEYIGLEIEKNVINMDDE